MGQLILFIISPVLSRIYGPIDFGVMAIFTSAIAIIGVNSSFRYELAILLPEDDKEALHVVVLALILNFLLTLLLFVFLFILGDALFTYLNAVSLIPYMYILPISVFGLGVYNVLSYWAIRKKEYGKIAKTKFSQSLGMSITQLLIGVMSSGPIGLLIGDAFGRIAGSGALGKAVLKDGLDYLKQFKFKKGIYVALKYKNFPLISSWSGFFNVVGLQLPPLVLAPLYGSSVVGWYSLGSRVVGAPIALLGKAVTQVYISEVPVLAKNSPDKLKGLLIVTTKRLFLIGILPTLLLIFFGPKMFAFIFGDSWYKTGVFVQLLGVMYLMEFIVSPVSQTLELLGSQVQQLIWQIIRITLVFSAFFLPKYIGAGVEIAISLYGLAMSISYILLLLLIFFNVRKLVKQQNKNSYL
ncbi:O-antigen/teichoic acid export membrane protein [Scopulibacillus darangshiensis]|uniref:O-antigen/teichoic acid export membrane protein n=1 Tax=Scopulibacillus darangshiensis TaxID=442528 RepID=A0A4R2NSI2_9BACL|nr:O-antigen/teichoic acid export membrane protein [Scopulibacillus darangshiensis]